MPRACMVLGGSAAAGVGQGLRPDELLPSDSSHATHTCMHADPDSVGNVCFVARAVRSRPAPRGPPRPAGRTYHEFVTATATISGRTRSDPPARRRCERARRRHGTPRPITRAHGARVRPGRGPSPTKRAGARAHGLCGCAPDAPTTTADESSASGLSTRGAGHLSRPPERPPDKVHGSGRETGDATLAHMTGRARAVGGSACLLRASELMGDVDVGSAPDRSRVTSPVTLPISLQSTDFRRRTQLPRSRPALDTDTYPC